jgi:multiple sugar transport system ATP-binding protein
MSSVTYSSSMRWHAGAPTPAVAKLDLHVPDGEFLVVVGPSGCGKSTSLRMLAGLEPVDGGKIMIGDRDVTHLAPKQRDIAMVFQNYALYPHMTVAENMGFALRMAGMSRHERAARVLEAARILDLEPYLDRKPKALSGGQRQRVAMGRAIVRQPQVFCMDEPLSNLDAKLRVAPRGQIASLQRRVGITTVYVTHDQVEAMTMGDRVAVLKDGELQQVGAPLDLYDRPANIFVAGFLGSPAMNLLEGTVTAGELDLGDGRRIAVDRDAAARATGAVTAGIRPEGWRVVGSDEPGLRITVSLVEEYGAEAFAYATADLGGRATQVVVRLDGRQAHQPGAVLHVAPRREAVLLFDRVTGERLGHA